MKALLAAVGLAALLVGCKKSADQSGGAGNAKPEAGFGSGPAVSPGKMILHRGNGSEPADLDPQIVTGVPEHMILMGLFECLTAEDPKDLHPVPGVAERWEVSADQLTYTFHLRKNAKWSNGDAVTARDFYESYKRILEPTLAAQYAELHFVVRNAEEYHKGQLKDFAQVGYKVVDDHTFQVTLIGPTPYFLSLINHTSWMPVHLPTIAKHGKPYERGGKWTRPENFVGNGPFTLDQWKVNEVITVKRNPHYWDAATVKLDGIAFYPISSNETEERMFRANQLHVTETVPLSKIPSYRKNHPDLIHIDPYLSTYFYRINVTKPPLNDKRVRKALALAIDREGIVNHITLAGQQPAYHLSPPNLGGYTSRARLAGGVPEAKKLLAEAGFPEGRGFPAIELLYNTSEAHRTIAEAIQQMWKKNLGIEARLLNQEWKVYLDSQRQLNYQVCRAGWTADYQDVRTFLDMWMTGGGNNETGWSNKEYDALIAQTARTVDSAARLELFQKAEAILMEELPTIPIYHYTRTHLISPKLKGWNPTLLDHHPYKHLSFE